MNSNGDRMLLESPGFLLMTLCNHLENSLNASSSLNVNSSNLNVSSGAANGSSCGLVWHPRSRLQHLRIRQLSLKKFLTKITCINHLKYEDIELPFSNSLRRVNPCSLA
ncbi:hypothetical protein LIER_43974 [Lithospermum erythrorhizon]|uniref:Uncharacterized protein n=1 Tax=Lithospermum erythrorhizon TaxID=34254 RepID=A0AAV3RDE3_LITER